MAWHAGRDLRLLLAANLVSLVGDWTLRTGIAYQIYVLTGSTLASAGAVLASLIPPIALGTLAGTVADRADRRLLMAGVNLLMAVALLPLLAVHGAGDAWLVYAVLAVQSCLAPFFATAEAALLPALTPPDRLVTANALNGQIRDIARLLGAALGGIVAAAGGIPLLAVADAASFLLAAGLLFLIRVRPVRSAASRAAGHGGWRIVARSRVLRVFVAFSLVTGIGEAAIGVLAAPFVRDVLGGDSRAYGFVMGVQAVGGLAGGLAVTLVGHRFPPRAMFGWGTVAFGLVDLALFLYPLVWQALWPAAVLIGLAGLPAAVLVAGGLTVFQRATAEAERGRVWGAITTVDSGAMLAGTLAAGALAGRFGVLPVITTQGAAYTLAGVLVVLALRPSDDAPRADLRLAPA
ncbi:MFS transporter [Actinoplanes sp. RD1]|uniref:MFS transporter n=1 Tax=Actinoplanes sp. RD1 TaxID=3064538 RepID=UPI00274279C4|nr:MFS transporter [Actinoplanes sp. RD1]